METMCAVGRTKTHPHGSCMTDSERSFGFIRISKCGSTTASEYLGLSAWIAMSEVRESEFVSYACVRSPIDRFVSGIPETLSRACPESRRGEGDVAVTDVIYRALCSLGTDPKRVVPGFIELIEEFGYFDAHHEPMINFLFTEDGRPELNARMFTTEDMDFVLPKIARLQGIDQDPQVRQLNVRRLDQSQGVAESPWGSLKKIKDKRPWKARAAVSRLRAGMHRVVPLEPPPMNSSEARMLYRQIREDQQVMQAAASFVETQTPHDILLHATVADLWRNKEELPSLRRVMEKIR